MGGIWIAVPGDKDNFNMHHARSTEQYDLPSGLIALPNK
jgi:hypothetical protein